MQGEHGQLDILQPVNWDSPLTRGLVSWWMANDGIFWGGPKFYDLCGRNHGVIVGAPSWRGPARQSGWGSLNLDGTSDYVEFSYSASISSFATCQWVYLDTYSNYDAFINFRTATEIGLLVTSTGRLGYLWENTADEYDCPSGIVIVTGEPMFVGIGISPTRAVLVGWSATNGWQTYTNTKTHNSKTPSGTWRIGSDSGGGGGREIDGRIDDVRAWNGVTLDETTFRNVFEDSRLGYPQTLNWQRRYAAGVQAGGGGATAFPWYYYQQMMAG